MKCKSEGCEKDPIERTLGPGGHYCAEHYEEVFFGELDLLWRTWEPPGSPPDRLLYLVGRMYEEQGVTTGDSYLSPARIRLRAWDVRKTNVGLDFCITRHPGAWTWGGPENHERVVQTWSVDLAARMFTLVTVRAWTEADPNR